MLRGGTCGWKFCLPESDCWSGELGTGLACLPIATVLGGICFLAWYCCESCTFISGEGFGARGG